MVENFSQIKEQLQSLWANLDKRAKVIIGSSVIVTFIGLLILANWASRPDYRVLFSNLAMDDAGEITERLEEQGVDYKLESDGSAILVPSSQVDRLRLVLASDGLPTGGVAGFELFDRNQIGTTDFEQNVNLTRALQGELTRTIGQLDSVEHARVQVSPRQRSIYRDMDEPAEASVFLKLRGRANPSKNEVEAIANLVASGVSGLAPEDVTIVDTAGNLLSAVLDRDSENEFGSRQLELKRDVEKKLERDLNMMLTRVFGVNNFVVTVNADLNFDERNIERKRYEPVVGDSGIVRSEQTQEERQRGTTTTPEGVPGTTSNIPQYRTTNEEESDYRKEDRIINYEINEEIERYVQAPGAVERISVSLIVNQDLDEQRRESITQAISTAVGYNANRGDQITVTGMEFDDSLAQMVDQDILADQARRRNILIAAVAIVALGILILLIILYKGRATDKEVQTGQNIDYIIDEAEDEFAAINGLSEEESQRQKLQNNLRKIIEDQPEEIAGLVKSWLAED
ncbi:flagellar basal-body MS-ring/collar protein FliF [Halonatronum saccharophilum]|uniref:flagellar basal-body MS-ring/collar protein FliF n=1 Tax=Halonatronum saccharophilum TaxID=150060 RepID=UPI000487A7CA|nr:flagellar basal-body MS-ring/collar protein FliF [Halonatronum saccharophilum]